MRADELMVGDWVKWKDKYVQIRTARKSMRAIFSE